jgi:8-oxo-dGTP pyrophosphatase MutT (NUDIX family)
MRISSEELTVISQYLPHTRNEHSLMQAAVAIILREGESGTEFLLMQRAHHKNDPWSGQMSFPGGKLESDDASAKAAAIREVEEEVGLVLTDDDYIGQLDDSYGIKVNRQYSVHVACFVFMPQRKLSPVGNYEVADLVWLPFSYLQQPARAYDHRHPSEPTLKMPAVLIDEDKQQILWGLSLRMLSRFCEILGKPLTAISAKEDALMQDMQERRAQASDSEP